MKFQPQYEQITSPKTVRDMLNMSVARFGDRVAFMQKENGRYKNYSYRRYRNDVEALGTALLGRGLFGKHIAVIGENGYAWAVCYMAVVCGVGVAVPVDKDLPDGAMTDILGRADTAAVLCSDAVAARLKTYSEKTGITVIAFSELGALIESGRAVIRSGEAACSVLSLTPMRCP